MKCLEKSRLAAGYYPLDPPVNQRVASAAGRKANWCESDDPVSWSRIPEEVVIILGPRQVDDIPAIALYRKGRAARLEQSQIETGIHPG